MRTSLIEKYLRPLGILFKFMHITNEQYSRGWYNEGTRRIMVHEFEFEGITYKLETQITGRQWYTLYEDDEYLYASTSQKDIVNKMKERIKL